MISGVSVVVCCHNSARELPEALRCLQAQEVPPNLGWEVVVVDNASTDDTVGVAQMVWAEREAAPLRLVSEAKLGLVHARKRGLCEASYDVVSFVDDDNWVSQNWVRMVAELAAERPTVGAFGGASDAVCETATPWWFDSFKGNYAISGEGAQAGDVTDTMGVFFGAGLSVRKAAWLQLAAGGFEPLLTGRKGVALSSGEDGELCFGLRMAGWRLWYDPRLRLRHYLPATRLRWDYLRRLFRGFGAADVLLDPYREVLSQRGGRRHGGWQWEYAIALARVSRHPLLFLHSRVVPCEGREEVLLLEGKLGRMQALLELRKSYELNFDKVRQLRERLGDTNPVGVA